MMIKRDIHMHSKVIYYYKVLDEIVMHQSVWIPSGLPVGNLGDFDTNIHPRNYNMIARDSHSFMLLEHSD